MRFYRTAWHHTACFLGLVGLCLALLTFPWSGLAIAFAITAVVAVAWAWAWPGSNSWRDIAVVGLTTPCAVLAGVTALELLGSAGAALLALLGVSSPPVMSRLASWLTRGGGAGDQRTATTSSAERTLTHAEWMKAGPADMDPASLCRAWWQSYQSLYEPLSPATRGHVIQRRQDLLDELERRNPAGFAAWLDSGARASSDPRRYIFTQDRPDTRP